MDKESMKEIISYNIVLKLAEEGDARCQLIIGLCYEAGVNTHINYPMAIKWYNKSLKNGNEEAKLRLNSLLSRMIELAKKEDTAALQCLSFCYERGIGMAKNADESFRLTEEAAKQGDPFSQNLLGDRYFKGIKFKQDYDRAFEWYYKAAEQNYTKALNNIGICYEKGLGISKNYLKAIESYYKAYKLNDINGKNNFRRLRCIIKDLAQEGDTLSQIALGFCYEKGYGMTKSTDNALELYLRVAEKMNKNNKNELIIDKITIAAKGGNARCQLSLGKLYYIGSSLPKNFDKAFSLFAASANQGGAEAKYFLGLCYKNGNGVRKNSELALNCFEAAAKQGFTLARNKIKESKNNNEHKTKSSHFMEPIQYNPISIESGIVKTKDIKDIND